MDRVAAIRGCTDKKILRGGGRVESKPRHFALRIRRRSIELERGPGSKKGGGG